MSLLDERLSIAPMMEWTDPHFRAFMRGITKRTVLYTEMVVDDTLLHSPCSDFFIGRHIDEQPSVIQLGGHDAENLGKAAEYCSRYYNTVLGGRYGEINLNCGCPSQRVSKRCFGAKLMLEPDLVRQIVYSMDRSCGGDIPITVKCRIGADEHDSYEQLKNFIACGAQGGCRKFIVHARKCLLKGLTTKQNRDIPPLRYEVVHSLQRDFPELTFVINGGIQSIQQAKLHICSPYEHMSTCEGFTTSILPAVHGAMIGRTAYSNPFSLATADSEMYGVSDPCLTRREVLMKYIDYCEWCQSEDGPRYFIPPPSTAKAPHDRKRLKMVSSSVLINAIRNSMCGLPNNQSFRKALNDLYQDRLKGINASPNPSCREVIEGALLLLNDEDLDRPLGRQISDVSTVRTLPGDALTKSFPTAQGDIHRIEDITVPNPDAGTKLPCVVGSVESSSIVGADDKPTDRRRARENLSCVHIEADDAGERSNIQHTTSRSLANNTTEPSEELLKLRRVS